jgi:hypothetical protein
MAPDHKSPFRLVVEGIDDKWTIINLLKRHSYDWDDPSQPRPFVRELGGFPAVLDGLSAALKTFARYGIVVDADQSTAKRWQAVVTELAKIGVSAPASPVSDGLVTQLESCRFGVWLMPDNQQPGMLEDLLATLVPTGDPCWAHAGQATTEARILGAPLRSSDARKGTMHAWLAWQEQPGQPFGTALTTRVLRHDSPQARAFVEWFRRLFVHP